MYHSYLEIKQSQNNAKKPRVKSKLIPRNIGYRRFKLDCNNRVIDIMDSMDTNPQMIKSGKKKINHNRLKIPLKFSKYHLEQFDKGEIKSIKIHKNLNYSIHFAIRHDITQLPKKPISKRPIRVIGIDLGINKAATLVVMGPKGVSITKTFVQEEKKRALEQLENRIADLQRTKEIRDLYSITKTLKYRLSKFEELGFRQTPLYNEFELILDKIQKFIKTSNKELLDEIELLNTNMDLSIKIALNSLFDHMKQNRKKVRKQINLLHKLQNISYLISILKKNISQKTNGILKKLCDLRDQRNNLSEEYDHQLTSEIVKYIDELKQRYEIFVAVGRLKGIQKNARKGNGNKSHRKRMHKWAFARFTYMLEYKLSLIALKNRFKVVDERWTSRTCWKCNKRGQRPKQPYFICIIPTCQWKGDADINGAINIAKKLIKIFKLTNQRNFGVRGLGRYLPVVSRKSLLGTRQSKNLPKAHSIGMRSPVHLPKGNGHAGADQNKQSDLVEWFDQNDLSVVKDMETLSPMKSVDRGAGRKHVSVKKEILVTRKRMVTSNKNC